MVSVSALGQIQFNTLWSVFTAMQYLANTVHTFAEGFCQVVGGHGRSQEVSAHQRPGITITTLPETLDLAPTNVCDHLIVQCPVQPADCVNASKLSLH